jgi:hypothetical protein
MHSAIVTLLMLTLSVGAVNPPEQGGKYLPPPHKVLKDAFKPALCQKFQQWDDAAKTGRVRERIRQSCTPEKKENTK